MEPLHCTALGKVLISHLPEDRQRELLDKDLESFTTFTKTDKEQILEECKQILEQGYALDNEEYDLSMRCVAAPVYNSKGKLAAAVGISGPVTRLHDDNINEYIDAVKEAAQNISSNLGYSRLLKR